MSKMSVEQLLCQQNSNRLVKNNVKSVFLQSIVLNHIYSTQFQTLILF